MTETYSLQAREVLQDESNVQPVVCVYLFDPQAVGATRLTDLDVPEMSSDRLRRYTRPVSRLDGTLPHRRPQS